MLINSKKGSSLLEVLIAVCIFSTAMLGAGFTVIQSLKYTRDSLSMTKNLIQVKSVNE